MLPAFDMRELGSGTYRSISPVDFNLGIYHNTEESYSHSLLSQPRDVGSGRLSGPPGGFASWELTNCRSPVTLDLIAPWALQLVMDLQGAATFPLPSATLLPRPRPAVTRAFPKPPSP